MASILQKSACALRALTNQLQTLSIAKTSTVNPRCLFSAVGPKSQDLNANTGPQITNKRWVTYDPYPRFESQSPYKSNPPYRYGYKNKLWGGGLLPRPDPDDADTRILPNKPYTYQKANAWSKKKALFGQNDYIDILGDGSLHPWRTMKSPPWLKGFRGNELQRNIRQLKFEGRWIRDMKPARYHQIRKNIFFLYKRMNKRKRRNYWGRSAGARCRIYRLKD